MPVMTIETVTCSECREVGDETTIGTCDDCNRPVCDGCRESCTGPWGGKGCRECHLARCRSRECQADS